MLGLLLIYFLGKQFYQLAEKHGRNEWGFAILGVIAYYVGTFIAGIVLVLGLEVIDPGSIDSQSELGLSIMALPFGLLSCYLFYKFLERVWTNKSRQSTDDLLDTDF